MFQHTAARRRLEAKSISFAKMGQVSTHSRPKAAGYGSNSSFQNDGVSTHSRPKAAGLCRTAIPIHPKRFNTQPPEGGWVTLLNQSINQSMFQHTAARRRLARPGADAEQIAGVSTHSRPKAAGITNIQVGEIVNVSTHSRPKAAGLIIVF